MSRTFRRKRNPNGKRWDDPEWYTTEFVWVEGRNCRFLIRVPMDSQSREYHKAVAIYHSDAATTNFKEPGPGWWRREFYQRPYRRRAANELRKFMLDEEYEPVIEDRPKLDWWT